MEVVEKRTSCFSLDFNINDYYQHQREHDDLHDDLICIICKQQQHKLIPYSTIASQKHLSLGLDSCKQN